MNKPSRKYSTVCLSHNDDLIGRERYVLNVKAEHIIESCFEELDSIFDMLYDRLESESLQKISRIAVYNSNDEIHCESEDIAIIEEDSACA
jgi:hypothetical protein